MPLVCGRSMIKQKGSGPVCDKDTLPAILCPPGGRSQPAEPRLQQSAKCPPHPHLVKDASSPNPTDLPSASATSESDQQTHGAPTPLASEAWSAPALPHPPPAARSAARPAVWGLPRPSSAFTSWTGSGARPLVGRGRAEPMRRPPGARPRRLWYPARPVPAPSQVPRALSAEGGLDAGPERCLPASFRACPR